MNIQFSQEAAQKACDSLADQSSKININRINLEDMVNNMQCVWKGDLANTVIGQLRSYDKTFEQIRGFVDCLDNHIAACQKNYNLTMKTNAENLKGIADMFL